MNSGILGKVGERDLTLHAPNTVPHRPIPHRVGERQPRRSIPPPGGLMHVRRRLRGRSIFATEAGKRDVVANQIEVGVDAEVVGGLCAREATGGDRVSGAIDDLIGGSEDMVGGGELEDGVAGARARVGWKVLSGAGWVFVEVCAGARWVLVKVGAGTCWILDV